MTYLQASLRNSKVWLFLISLIACGASFGMRVAIIPLVATIVVGGLLLDDHFAFVSKHSKQGGHDD